MEERTKLEEIGAESEGKGAKPPQTMTIIGRVKAGVNVRNVNLNKLFQQFTGGGHPKAASATAKVADEGEARKVLQRLVDELIETGLTEQLTVGEFMQSPVLSAKPTMTEKQVEDLFLRYDVRALPVVNDNNEVIGLVSYKEVTAARTRLLNKREKRLRRMERAAETGESPPPDADRPLESALKGWMKQHVQIAEASTTMAEVEQILLETDVGCIPVVADGTKQLIGMVTRTDLLRQHRYYQSLHYHNKGFSDSIAARKPIIELRKKLKKFDVESE
jgi:tRNA nucleotidyltransferase (CCA-adding enzyme)